DVICAPLPGTSRLSRRCSASGIPSTNASCTAKSTRPQAHSASRQVDRLHIRRASHTSQPRVAAKRGLLRERPATQELITALHDLADPLVVLHDQLAARRDVRRARQHAEARPRKGGYREPPRTMQVPRPEASCSPLGERTTASTTTICLPSYAATP